jgi:hypothetical protein
MKHAAASVATVFPMLIEKVDDGTHRRLDKGDAQRKAETPRQRKGDGKPHREMDEQE